MKQIRKTWLFVSVLVLGCPLAAMAQAEPPYDLGELPEGFEVRWPEPPELVDKTTVATAAEFNAAAATPGTKIVVTASIPGTVRIAASDIEVRMEDGASVGGLSITRGARRIHVHGCRIGAGGITMAYPTVFYPSRVTDPDWAVEDVLFEEITVEAGPNASALALRGNRVAVIGSHLHGGDYAIWSDTSAPLVNSDVIIAGNVLEAEGDQATLRLVGVHNSVTVDNRLENLMLTGRKHNYRVHAESDQVFAARNLLVNAGTMFGTMPGDMIGEMWFENNEIYHLTEDLFQPARGKVLRLHARGNTAFSARPCFMCSEPPAEWEVEDNELFPYEPAPAE